MCATRKTPPGARERATDGNSPAHDQATTDERGRDDGPLRRSQAQLALQYAVTSILATSSLVSAAIPRVLEIVCMHLDWDVGVYWAVDRDDNLLRRGGFWRRASLDVDRFEARTREITFRPGVGLPGRVWSGGRPILIPDVGQDANFPRAAAAHGLHGAVCFPIMSGEGRDGIPGMHGVMEFLCRDTGDLDVDLIQALTTVGTQIGQFAERAQAEAARRETETRRAAVVDTALDAIITMDHTGRVIEFNPAAEHIFGYSRDEALGRELADLIIPPNLRARHRAGLATYVATGEGPLIGRRLEITAMRRDTTLFPAEVAITRVPLDGAPLFSGYIRDITERKRTEAALRESEERLRTVIANAPVVLFAVDRDGVFTLSEGKGLAALGIRPGEHVGQSYFALYRDLPDSVAAMRRALSGDVATTVNRYKGFVFETRWMPTTDADGTVAGVIGVSTDITERTWIEEERAALLERERVANRRMDEFLGIAGHEMRTPLTTITGNLQLAQRRLARLHDREDEQSTEMARRLLEVQHLLDRTDTQMRRLGRLVDDILDVSRIQAGRLEIRRLPCDLVAVVRDVVDEQRDLAPTRTIVLEGADDATIPVIADAERIAQVLTNYLTNAIKYSGEERPVTVGVGGDGGMARVWVRDEGPGLAPDEQGRIWDVFYRVAGVEHRHGSSVGLGMGLHISRTIVEQHGGHVGVDSSPGHGATFWFTLPP